MCLIVKRQIEKDELRNGRQATCGADGINEMPRPLAKNPPRRERLEFESPQVCEHAEERRKELIVGHPN